MRKSSVDDRVAYNLDADGCFVIDDYNRAKTFSNFFPGIAGLWGTPMWVFYVNRGQCIASFGIESKDKAILEFQPANKAYRLAPAQGFRTFLNIRTGGQRKFWEPFCVCGDRAFRTRQKMSMTADDLTIEDANATLGLTVRVNYFTVAGEDYPALVRRVTLENTSRKVMNIEMVDGLPAITPYGIKDWLAKNLSRTVEAWVRVANVAKNAPYYNLNVEVSDTPDVRHITEGHFYFGFSPGSSAGRLARVIVDPEVVFGPATDFSVPRAFRDAGTFRVPAEQQTSNRTPCAMTHTAFRLGAGQKKEVVSLAGHAHGMDHLHRIVRRAKTRGFIARKARDNRAVVADVRHAAWTKSDSPVFDLYCSQTFLDNVLRGGWPVSLKTGEGKAVFNVFSRKHGDLERDYNFFTLAPTYYSQGNGNYRDVNQNRRNDVWFNRDVGDTMVVDFLSLIQADGYNPLIVRGLSFIVEDERKLAAVLRKSVLSGRGEITKRLGQPFQPGELLQFVARRGIKLKVGPAEFIGRVLAVCRKMELAEHGEGFWTDHWHYNMDLIERYLALYPDDLDGLLQRKAFTFYLSSHRVLPRSRRYLLTGRGVRQYHSVADGSQEPELVGSSHRLRTQHGKGEDYQTTLLAKLLCVIANKAATFDPSGIGIEMEADKPNWYDALNGLPGLLGSSLSETLELKRFCRFLLDAMERPGLVGGGVAVFDELATFIRELKSVLALAQDPLVYWEKANAIKEEYRERVRHGIKGWEQQLPAGEIMEFLQLIEARCDKAAAKARDSKGEMATYFYHEVTAYDELEGQESGLPYVMPTRFRCHALPPFLEGYVHFLRTQRRPDAARGIYRTVRKSRLFDRELKMYKVNARLSEETEEIGRTRIFPPGWLENESVWLHMEYKYLLELLHAGLYEEFYETFKDVLIPFQDAARYGRSTLENSSFIVSSAHEDDALHGRGFVARLSGSTAEFLHIWLVMNAGRTPFVMRPEGLTLELKPALAGWLFTHSACRASFTEQGKASAAVRLPAGSYAFCLLARTLVVYHNPARKDTFGRSGAEIKRMSLRYAGRKKPVEIAGGVVPSPYAADVRAGKVERIDAYLG